MKHFKLSIDGILYTNFVSTLILLCFSKLIFLKYLGFDYQSQTTVYAIGSFMTEAGVFDDYYNSLLFAFDLPNSKSSYLLSPLMMIYSRIATLAPYLFHLLFILMGLIFWASGLIRFVGSYRNTLLLVLSYPVLFAISRSNAIFIASGCVLLAYAYQYSMSPKESHSVSFILLGCSFHPGCLILTAGLPLHSYLRNWRIVSFFVALNIAFIYFISDGEFLHFIHSYFSSLNLYKENYVIGSGGTLLNNSLYGLLKIILLLQVDSIFEFNSYLLKLSKTYNIFAFFVPIGVILYSFLTKDWIKKLLALLTLSVVLPQISADYKLEFIVIAIAVLIYANKIGYIKIGLVYYGLLITYLLIIFPKHFLFFRHFANISEFFTIQSIVNPVLIGFSLVFLFKLDCGSSKMHLNS